MSYAIRKVLSGLIVAAVIGTGGAAVALAQNPYEFVQPHTNPDSIIKYMVSANNSFALETETFLDPAARGSGLFKIYDYVNTYAQTPQYDPLGGATQRLLFQYAYEYEQEEDGAKKSIILDKFQKMVKAHMANYNAVTVALSLARGNEDLFDVEALEAMRGLLQERVLESGTGNTLRTAYKIYTAEEETFVLLSRQVEILETEEITTPASAHNIHRVINLVTKEPETVYTNITPIWRQRLRDAELDAALIRQGRPRPQFELWPLD